MRPDERDIAVLRDMRDACREVMQFMEGVDLEQFVKDRLTRYAVERCLEIVGEASKKVSYALRRAHPEIPWKNIAGFRDVLAHDYMDLDHALVYAAAHDRVPALLVALEAALAEVREASTTYRVRRRIRLDVNPRLLMRARAVAFCQGKTLSELAEEGLRELLADRRLRPFA